MTTERSEACARPASGTGGRVPVIFHVDDDSLWRILTARALHQRGHNVVSFDSGTALLSDPGSAVPDLVIVDAVMPEVDGFELCARLRLHERFADCPVLMLTSLDQEEAIGKAYEAGATDVFIKSTHWTLLSERIKHLCRMARMQKELYEGHDWLATVHRSSRVGLFEFDVRARVLRGPPGSFVMLGYPESTTSISELEFMSLMPQEFRDERFRRERTQPRMGGVFRIEIPIESKQGRKLTVGIETELRRDVNGRVLSLRGLMRDVSEAVRAEQEIARLSSVDPVTGLPNRDRFIEVCTESIAGSRASGMQTAVIVMDMDRFGQINESLGPAAGDEVLRQVGECLGAALAAYRTEQQSRGIASPHSPVLARLPGDQFAVVLPMVAEQAEVASTVEALLAAMKRPFVAGGTECFVSWCAGVAIYPRDGDHAGKLMSHAGSALFEAKANGSRSVGWYVPPLKAAGRVRLQMLSGLHKALERGEFELHYQACVDASAGTIIGVEALARWRHEGMLVPPLEFVGLAEESGLIVPIGEWAIDEAGRQIRHWTDANVTVPKVSVNISTLHFGRPSLAESVRAAIRKHRLVPGMLEIELTESCMVRDFAGTLGGLHVLRNLGVSLSLDDFGTGYSSLSYLTRLPIDKLKIDRSFVRLLGVSAEGEAIVRAIVALGQSLRLEVIAEGVETAAQATRLLEMGCAGMQGFLLAPPVPAERVPSVIARARSRALALFGAPRQAGAPSSSESAVPTAAAR